MGFILGPRPDLDNGEEGGTEEAEIVLNMLPGWLQSLHPGSQSRPGTFPLLPTAKTATSPGTNNGAHPLACVFTLHTSCPLTLDPLLLAFLRGSWLYRILSFACPHLSSLPFPPTSACRVHVPTQPGSLCRPPLPLTGIFSPTPGKPACL